MVHPLIEQRKVVLAAGVYDVFSAKIAERAGFHSVVVTGFGVAASHLGEPDFGLLTQTEVLNVARRVVNAVDIGVVIDGDTGFGGPLNVYRPVKEALNMGAGGCCSRTRPGPSAAATCAASRWCPWRSTLPR